MVNHTINKKKIRDAVRLLLEAIGENPDRDGLKETPDRVARMYEEMKNHTSVSARNSMSNITKLCS
jgi:GTP cyclohydrolase I